MVDHELLIDSHVETITPKLAAKWLERNTHNRPIKQDRCDVLAQAIKRGEWLVNGDAIRFSEDGALLDGQHRLQAIVKAGMPVQSFVTRGLAARTFPTIDSGRGRTTGDVMTLAGLPGGNNLAATARCVFYYELTGFPYDQNGGHAPTNAQLLDIAERELVRTMTAVSLQKSKKFARKFVGSGVTAFCMYATYMHNAQSAQEFWRLIDTGAGLALDSPVLALRERLMNSQAGDERMPPWMRAAYVFKGYRLFHAGVPTKRLWIDFPKGAPRAPYFDLGPAKLI